MLNRFLSADQLRRKFLKTASHAVMQNYFSTPFPNLKTPWNEIEIVSLDFETTGLDPLKDQILSYGKVEIDHGLIKIKTAEHGLIKARQSIPESSAIIHHITDDLANSGLRRRDALPRVLEFLRGKVMLVHYNKIEQGFLNAACQTFYGSPFVIPTIDTLELAQRVLSHRNHAIEPHQLRLFNLRKAFKLPIYKAHNALGDALTTAELFLVLEGEISPRSATRLKDLII
jgi:DNA polymerase-3 subunit epsilon